MILSNFVAFKKCGSKSERKELMSKRIRSPDVPGVSS